MARTVGIGIQDFEKIIANDVFYIDKTHFVKEWWESNDDVTLIARPRRFGKTLNLNMLDYFFSINHAQRSDLFEKLYIWKDETYRKLQGTYPVISLSFANVKETSFELTRFRICQLLKMLYVDNEFLVESDKISKTDKILFEKMKNEMTENDSVMAIHYLSKWLYQYYNKKVIILLDEYDTPMQESYVHGFWEELAAFTRSLFHSTFKTNPYLAKAVMTGITRVSKESIFSDLNNLKVVTTTSDEYATSFGFTEEEVFAALEEYELGTEKESVKHWYDGFTFGSHTDIYNPWSLINFLDTRKYGAYWANTSSNSLVGKLIRESNEEIKQSFQGLLKGEHLKCAIDEQIVYNQLAIWSLLLASGYLKVVGYELENDIEFGEEPLYELALTNYEVEKMFRNMVRGWFAPAKPSYNNFIKALMLGDVKAMNTYMNRVSLQIFSHFDTGKGPWGAEPEKFYHGFVLGLLVELNSCYVITSNRESGFGRYDVMLEPKNKGDKAFIFEFKVHDKEEGSMEDTVKMALQQIEDKQYETSLIARGIEAERIYKYGFAFQGKTILIG